MLMLSDNKVRLKPFAKTCSVLFQLDSQQCEMMQSFVGAKNCMVLPHNEHVTLPKQFTFIWEVCAMPSRTGKFTSVYNFTEYYG